jgi:hypothetical protein
MFQPGAGCCGSAPCLAPRSTASPSAGARAVLPTDLPFTPFLSIIRGIALRGIGLADPWSDVWPGVAFRAVIFTPVVVRFRASLG